MANNKNQIVNKRSKQAPALRINTMLQTYKNFLSQQHILYVMYRNKSYKVRQFCQLYNPKSMRKFWTLPKHSVISDVQVLKQWEMFPLMGNMFLFSHSETEKNDVK